MLKRACKKLKQYVEQETEDIEDGLEIDSIEDANLMVIQDLTNQLILFRFNKTVKWIGFSIEDALLIAHTLLQKADLVEKETEKQVHSSLTIN